MNIISFLNNSEVPVFSTQESSAHATALCLLSSRPRLSPVSILLYLGEAAPGYITDSSSLALNLGVALVFLLIKNLLACHFS